MKILHVVIVIAAIAAAFLVYKKMKLGEKPIIPMTTSEPLPVDYLDDSNGNGTDSDSDYQDLIDAGPVGDYSMSPVASALTATSRGYMAWYPGHSN